MMIVMYALGYVVIIKKIKNSPASKAGDDEYHHLRRWDNPASLKISKENLATPGQSGFASLRRD